MPQINAIHLEGNACSDPREFDTANGKGCGFRFAANVGWGDRKASVFYDVTCFGHAARFAAEDVTSGAHLILSGRVEANREYQANDGTAKESACITAETVSVQRQSHERQGVVADTFAPAAASAPASGDMDSDDIPF